MDVMGRKSTTNFFFFFFFFFFLGPSANAPEAPQPKAYCATLNINQPSLNNPVLKMP
jgi:hypothetical protein